MDHQHTKVQPLRLKSPDLIPSSSGLFWGLDYESLGGLRSTWVKWAASKEMAADTQQMFLAPVDLLVIGGGRKKIYQIKLVPAYQMAGGGLFAGGMATGFIG